MKPHLALGSVSFAAAVAALLGAAIAACGGLGEADQLFGDTSGGNGGSGGHGGASSGSSMSTSTSTTGPGHTSTGVTSTGSGTGAEDCLDGIDNDKNGAVDCADTACQARFHCVDADPGGGWKGHYYITKTTLPAQDPGPCPPDLQANGGEFANPAGPAECSACTCGGLQGAACSPPGISCFPGSNACMGTGQNWTAQLSDGACHKPALAGVTFAMTCKLTSAAALTSPGSCQPSSVDFPNKDPFQQRIDACGTDKVGGGCPSGQVCVPKGQGGANESLCVRRDGAQTCPAGWNTKISGYTNAADTRACSTCACGAPGTTCGDGYYTVYDLDQCQTVGQSTPPATIGTTTCIDVSGELDQGSWSIQATLPTPKGTCAASGGAPSGSVQPSGEFTYCCQ